MSFQTGSIDKNGLARTEDGKLYVTSVGTASITGGTINAIDVTTFVVGTYTPTLTNTTNVAASTSGVCNYMRMGSMVHVSGVISIDPTAGTASTVLGISLPVASNFAANGDLGGTAACVEVTGYSAGIYADSTNDRATLQFVTAADAANRVWAFSFMYRVI
jgi:hypothetical protein